MDMQPTIQRTVVAVPARLQSSRLPGKVLADIGGKPMLQRVAAVVLCTDSDRLQAAAAAWGVPVLMTSPHCSSGSERIASVADQLVALAWNASAADWDDASRQQRLASTAVINVQGDQPFLDPAVVTAMDAEFRRRDPVPAVVTPVYRLQPDTIHNPAVVKTLLAHDGRALYFRLIGITTAPTGAMWASTASAVMCWRPGISCRRHRWRIWSGWSSCA